MGDCVHAGLFEMWHRHHVLCALSHLDLIKNQRRFGSRTSWHRMCSSQTETKLAVCGLLWHFQGQCTQFTIFVNKTVMAAFLLCGGCIPRLLLSLYSFASHQSVSWVKDLISAVGVAPENVLCCSPSLKTQAAQWENTCQTPPCCCQTTPDVTIFPFLARQAHDRLSGDIAHKT